MSTPTCKHDWHFVQGLTERLRCTRCGLMTGPKSVEERTQEMLNDVLTTGTGVLRVSSEGVQRIDPTEVYQTHTYPMARFYLDEGMYSIADLEDILSQMKQAVEQQSAALRRAMEPMPKEKK